MAYGNQVQGSARAHQRPALHGADTEAAPSALAMVVLPPHVRPQPAAFRTLLSTEYRADAYECGFDGPAEPGTDGGFSISFDGRYSAPSVVMVGSDGQIEITGLAAIREARKALEAAEKLAERQS